MKVGIRRINSFCPECGFLVKDAEIRSDISRIEIGETKFICNRHYAICPICEKEIYVASFNDANAKAREEAYNEAIRAKRNK